MPGIRRPLRRVREEDSDSDDEYANSVFCTNTGGRRVGASSHPTPEEERERNMIASQLHDLGSSRRNHITTDTYPDQRNQTASIGRLLATRKVNDESTPEATTYGKNKSEVISWSNFRHTVKGDEKAEEFNSEFDGQLHRSKVSLVVSQQTAENQGIRPDIFDDYVPRSHFASRGGSGSGRGRGGGFVGSRGRGGGNLSKSSSNSNGRPLDPAVDPNREYRYSGKTNNATRRSTTATSGGRSGVGQGRIRKPSANSPKKTIPETAERKRLTPVAPKAPARPTRVEFGGVLQENPVAFPRQRQNSATATTSSSTSGGVPMAVTKPSAASGAKDLASSKWATTEQKLDPQAFLDQMMKSNAFSNVLPPRPAPDAVPKTAKVLIRGKKAVQNVPVAADGSLVLGPNAHIIKVLSKPKIASADTIAPHASPPGFRNPESAVQESLDMIRKVSRSELTFPPPNSTSMKNGDALSWTDGKPSPASVDFAQESPILSERDSPLNITNQHSPALVQKNHQTPTTAAGSEGLGIIGLIPTTATLLGDDDDVYMKNAATSSAVAKTVSADQKSPRGSERAGKKSNAALLIEVLSESREGEKLDIKVNIKPVSRIRPKNPFDSDFSIAGGVVRPSLNGGAAMDLMDQGIDEVSQPSLTPTMSQPSLTPTTFEPPPFLIHNGHRYLLSSPEGQADAVVAAASTIVKSHPKNYQEASVPAPNGETKIKSSPADSPTSVSDEQALAKSRQKRFISHVADSKWASPAPKLSAPSRPVPVSQVIVLKPQVKQSNSVDGGRVPDQIPQAQATSASSNSTWASPTFHQDNPILSKVFNPFVDPPAPTASRAKSPNITPATSRDDATAAVKSAKVAENLTRGRQSASSGSIISTNVSNSAQKNLLSSRYAFPTIASRRRSRSRSPRKSFTALSTKPPSDTTVKLESESKGPTWTAPLLGLGANATIKPQNQPTVLREEKEPIFGDSLLVQRGGFANQPNATQRTNERGVIVSPEIRYAPQFQKSSRRFIPPNATPGYLQLLRDKLLREQTELTDKLGTLSLQTNSASGINNNPPKKPRNQSKNKLVDYPSSEEEFYEAEATLDDGEDL